MKRYFAALFFALVPSLCLAQTALLDTSAKQAYLIDLNTQTVLLDKGGEDKMPTSSMSKMMTIYMVFDALRAKKISLSDDFTVSEKAWRMEGSRSFMNINSKVKVEDLIRGVIIQSGNDAAMILAEGVAGSESAFMAMSNDKAQSLGMKNSHFTNPAGLPDPEHYSTPQDLALLAWHLIYDFPEYYHYFGEKEFVFNNIKQGNRNPLLYRNIGADGLKTGHADEAGYGITASAIRDGRRLILVVNGLANMQERADESARLISYGFDEFSLVTAAKKDEAVRSIKIIYGVQKSLSLVVNNDVAVTVRNDKRSRVKTNFEITEPIEAPIAKGSQLGKMNVILDDKILATVPLMASDNVEKLPFFELIWAKLKFMITGKYDE